MFHKNYRHKKILVFAIAICFLLSQTFLASPVFAQTTDTGRIAGDDRYKTAVAISEKGWQKADYAVLARGDNFADALCAGPLAHKYKGPILLTESKQLNPATLAELQRLGVKHLFIAGGYNAVSQDVEDAVKAAGITDIERIFGDDRYATSVKIAEKLGTSARTVLATGDNFPDALSISVIASKLGMPILLTAKDKIPTDVANYLQENAVTQTYLVGGSGVISSEIENQVPGSLRLAGTDRYETNIAILKNFEREFNFENIYVSTGTEFADALTGAVLAAKSSSPLILTGRTLPTVAASYLKDKVVLATKAIGFGGQAAVPSSVLDGIMHTKKDIVVSEKYDKAGIYGPETDKATISGSVIISAADVTLRNTIIEGDLLLAQSIGDGDVTLRDVTVKGKTIINGGGPNSVILYNFNGQTVIVDVPENSSVRLVAQGDTSISNVAMEANGILEEADLTGSGFVNVVIPAGAQVTLAGTFEQVDVEAAGANVTVTAGSITTMTIAETAAGAGVNLASGTSVSTLNANAVSNITGEGQITTANVNTSDVTIAQTPSNTNVASGVTANVGGQEQTGTTTPSTGGGGGGSSKVAVSAISVKGTGDATNITTQNGTLQMIAEVGPSNASNKAITWSVENGTGKATISEAGLLTAVADGTVTVKATSVSTPTVSGTAVITISGQIPVVEADLTAYNAALAAVVEADYTVDSWTTYQAVVDANVVTVANTQEEVDAATGLITTAQADLVFAGQADLDAAKAAEALLNEDDYVDYSAVTAALALPENTNAEVVAKASAITDAIAALEEVEETFTVTFDSDGGSAVASATVNKGEKVAKPTDPTKDGFTFGEWQLDGATYDFDTAVTADITLKATWTAVDKSALTTAVADANTNKGTAVVSTDGSEVDPAAKWVTSAEMTAYTDAIAAAQTVADNADATQAEVDQAVTDLATATDTFNTAKKDGTKADIGDTTDLKAAITSAQSLHDGATEGTEIGQYAVGSKATLKAAIDAAQAVVDQDPAATTAEVTAAEGALADAVAAFEAGKVLSDAKAITGTTVGTLDGGNIKDVPAGTKVSALKAALTVSDKATAEILVGTGGNAVADQENTDVIATMVIQVTAEDGSKAEYTIAMEAPKSTDATLSDLTVNGVTVENFAAETLTYNVELAAGTTVVPTVVATVNDTDKANAVVTAAGSLPGATTVLVTAEDGTTTKTYTINFTVAANADQDAPTGLAGVAPTTESGSDGKITGTTTAMEYKLASAEDSTYADCGDSETTGLAAGDYVVRLAAKEGFNAGTAAEVTVPAYKAPKSEVTTIAVVSGKEAVVTEVVNTEGSEALTVAFGTEVAGLLEAIESTDASTQSYAVTNSEDTAKTEGALVTSDKLVVTAEDGIAKVTYTITVADAPKSVDASVSSVTVAEVAATVDSEDTTIYNVELPYDTVLANLTASDIVVTATDTNATVGEATTSDEGATWTVAVTAEDGTTTETYTINVTLATPPASTDASLTALAVNQGSITFDAETLTYSDVEVPYGTGSVEVTFTAANGATTNATSPATVTITDGAGTFTVEVTAEDETTKQTYTISFVEAAVTSASLVSPKEYDLNAVADVTTAVTLNDATAISGIKNGEADLTADADYTFAEGTLTIKQAYLTGLGASKGDTITLVVSFDKGNAANLVINVVDSAPLTYAVTFSVTGANGTLAATVDASAIASGDAVEAGKDVVFTASPATGYQVKEWTVGGAPVAGNTTTSLTATDVQAATAVTVEFEAIPPATIATAAATLASPAIGEPGIDATVDGEANYTHTSTVWSGKTGDNFAAGDTPVAVITLAAKAGYTFTGLTADNITVADGTVSYAGGQGVQGEGISVVFTVTYPKLAAPDTIVNALNLTTLVTAPVKDAAPNTTAIDETQYSGTIEWFGSDGTTPVAGNFAASTVYVAKVSLTAKAGYTLTGVAANSFTYTGATVTNAADSGEVTITFPATEVAPVTVTEISVKTAPNKATYTAGDTLDLTGLEVTLTKSDTTTEDVAFADFASKGITASPANGATLATTDTEVTLNHTESGKSVAQAITVNVAPSSMTWLTPQVAIANAVRPTALHDGTKYHIWYVEDKTIKHKAGENPFSMASSNADQCKINGENINTTTFGDNPFVIKEDTTYYMFISNPDGSAINVYSSADGTAWILAKEGVLSRGTGDVWDADKIDNPMVIHDETGYKLYYQGYRTVEDVRQYKIGVATCDSIADSYTKSEQNPIIQPATPEAWDSGRVFQPWVVKDGTYYYMWYAGSVGAAGPQGIGFVYSVDGINWTKADSNPILKADGDSNKLPTAVPTVVKANDNWHMWYLCGKNINYISTVEATPEVTFTFSGLDAVTAGTVDFTITTKVTNNGAIANDIPLRYKAVVTKDGEPLADQVIKYPEATDVEWPNQYHTFTTDSIGTACFGPDTGFTLMQLPDLLTAEGVTTPFQADFAAGEYSVTVSLLDISNSGEVVLGSGTKEFTATSTVNVTTYEELNAALEDANIETINITADITVDKPVSVNRAVTINGNGKTISATTFETVTGTNGLFVITADATVQNLVLDGGSVARGVYVGGNTEGINVNLTGLTIQNCEVDDKSSNRGAAANSGAAVRATSGKITLSINNCTIKDNIAYACAGGISFDNVNGTLTVLNSAIQNNTGGYYAGGIWTASTADIVVELTNNTITGNKLSEGATKYPSCCTTCQDIFINSNSYGNGGCTVAGGTIGCIHVEGEDAAGSILTVTGAANFTDVHGVTNNSKLVISGDGANAKFGESTMAEGTYTWSTEGWVKGN